jgi:nitrite reductase/ring-hydroxylating ferredoxin subunit
MNERQQFSKVLVGKATAFADPGRKVVEVDGREIGIFHVRGSFYAYANICPHMGGPVCQGQIIPRVEEVVEPSSEVSEPRFSSTDTNIICPWHGFEFSIQTGQHYGNAKVRLKSVPVSVIDGEVYIDIGVQGQAA